MNNKRKEIDKKKIILAGFEIEESKSNNSNEFYITNFKGPKDSLYEGGNWKLHILLPETYPYKSPSIGFVNKIFHPNVDEKSGTICLDVINQTWSPSFELKNIFEEFLPQLLLYPNPTDPLNQDAANLLLHNKKNYEEKVKKYVNHYAKDKQISSRKESKNLNENNTFNNDNSNNDEKLLLLHKRTSKRIHNSDFSLDFFEFVDNDHKNDKTINTNSNKEDDDNESSVISSSSYLNEELEFGKIHKEDND